MNIKSSDDLAYTSDGSSKILLAVVVFAIIAAIAFFSYNLGSKKDNDSDTSTTDENTVEATVTTKPEVEPTKVTQIEPTTATIEPTTETVTADDITLPDNWEPVENTAMAYIAYRPNNWWFRYFDNMKLLGLDPNSIPEVGEYAGMLTITVSSDSLTSAVSDKKSNMTSPVESSIIYSNGKWTILEGTYPASELFDAKKVKAALSEQGGKTVIIEYQNDPSSFGSNENVFDTLVGVIEFEQ